jgi:hypothetical protein
VSRVDDGAGVALRAVADARADEADRTTGVDRPQAPADARLAARIARAERYLNEHLKDQRGWYSKRAAEQKAWSQRLGLAVIVCGALVTFAQAFAGVLPMLVPAVTAALGVAVAVLTGVQRIWKYDESWPAYRRASEQMKREYRLYINGAGAYSEVADEDAAYRRFVENTEAIIAEEQQIYWKSRTDERKDGATDNKPKPGQGAGQG